MVATPLSLHSSEVNTMLQSARPHLECSLALYVPLFYFSHIGYVDVMENIFSGNNLNPSLCPGWVLPSFRFEL